MNPPTTRVCPLCTLRTAGLVAQDCPICAGAGTLTLGHAAVTEYGPETISTAVHLALERRARELDRHPHARSTDPRPALTETLGRLTAFGIITDPKAPGAGNPTPRTRPDPYAVASLVGTTPDTVDHNMIRAHTYPYRWNDRPGSRRLPLTSHNFHPSSLARLGDPQPFETTTGRLELERTKHSATAGTLLMFIDGATL